MTFSKTIFLVGLLPWFVIIFRLFSSKKNILIKSICLLLANSLFIIWGGVGGFLVLCIFSFVISLLSFLVYKFKRKWVITVCILLAVLPLVYMKYSIFIIDNINILLGLNVQISKIIVPMGISFVTFEAVSLLVDIYKSKVKKNPNILATYLYLSFFPTITSGPIIRYNEFENGLLNFYSTDYRKSIERIIVGLSKKVLVADKLAFLADYYFDGIANANSFSCAGLWLGSIAYTLQLYFDFSGYSDMAIGIGQLLGFDICENFDKPYRACSISEFWKKWHKSLTLWFRDYIYIPLGGNRVSKPRHIVNMLVVWLITGLWHGADWSFIIWGIGYFLLLTAEKYIPVMKSICKGLFGHIYTLFLVNLLWIPFRTDNLRTAGKYLYGMFGGGSNVIESKAIAFVPFIIVAIILCFPLEKLFKKISDKQAYIIFKGLVMLLLVFLSICAAVNSSYTPYIYGNF